MRCEYCNQKNHNSEFYCRCCGAPLPDSLYEPEVASNIIFGRYKDEYLTGNLAIRKSAGYAIGPGLSFVKEK